MEALHNKVTLFYRVFKSRFFPHCSILRPKILDPVHTHGEESYKGGMSFKWTQGGDWEWTICENMAAPLAAN